MPLRPFRAISSPSSPLLEEKGGVLLLALALDVQYPLLSHGASLGAGFTADNDPVNTIKVYHS